MRRFRTCLTATLSALMIVCAARAASADAANANLDQLLREIRATLIIVQSDIAKNNLPPLKSVEITIQTAIEITGGGKVKLFVISLGDSITTTTAQSIKITLTPPRVSSETVSGTANFSKEFAAAIVSVARTIARSSQQKPPLNLTNLQASIKFTSKTTLEGGVINVQILPVSIDLGGQVSPTNTHEAVLTFGAASAGGN